MHVYIETLWNYNLVNAIFLHSIVTVDELVKLGQPGQPRSLKAIPSLFAMMKRNGVYFGSDPSFEASIEGSDAPDKRCLSSVSQIQDEDSEPQGDSEDEWDDLYENPQSLVSELHEMEIKRQQIAQEMLSTETSYSNKLKFMLTLRKQLQSINSLKDMVPTEDLDKMFPCLDELLRLHRDSIIPNLTTAVNNWTTDSMESSPGKVLSSHLSKFKIYIDLINSHPTAVKLINHWSSKEPKFQKILKIFEKHDACGHLNVMDILHEPYVRLQRWRLLLQRYKKYLPKTSLEHSYTNAALEEIERILKECESSIRDAVELTALLDLDVRIDGVMAFLTPDTVLLKEGPITEIDPRNKQISIMTLNRRRTNHHLFLFNHFLLICRPIDGGKRHSISGKFQLSSVQVYDCDTLMSKECDSTLWCVIQTPNKAIYIRFGSTDESNDWKAAIRSASLEAETRKSFKRSDLSCSDFTRAPVWVPDDAVTSCMLCSLKFSIVRRRHHCRGCGILICSNCSGGKLRLPYEKMSMNIVCKKCLYRASKFAPHLLPVLKPADDVTPTVDITDEQQTVLTLTTSADLWEGSIEISCSEDI